MLEVFMLTHLDPTQINRQLFRGDYLQVKWVNFRRRLVAEALDAPHQDSPCISIDN